MKHNAFMFLTICAFNYGLWRKSVWSLYFVLGYQIRRA